MQYIFVKRQRMRKMVQSQKVNRSGKLTSRERKPAIHKLGTAIDELHSYLINISTACGGFDFAWLLEQEQVLAGLSSRLRSQPQEELAVKLYSCESILQTFRKKITEARLNSIDVAMIDSTHHHASCEGRLRQKTVPTGCSIQKLKQTVPARPSKSRAEDYTPLGGVASDSGRQSVLFEKQSRDGTYEKRNRDGTYEKQRQQGKLKDTSEKETQSTQSLLDMKYAQRQNQTQMEEKHHQMHLKRIQSRAEEKTLKCESIQTEEIGLRRTNHQSQRILSMDKDPLQIQAEKLKDRLLLAQRQITNLKVENGKLSKEREYLTTQTNKYLDTIAILNNRIVQLERELFQAEVNTSKEIAANKQHDLKEKENMIRQLIYEKENYSDGYAQLKKEKFQHLRVIKDIEEANQKLQQEFADLQRDNESLKEQVHELEEAKLKLEQRICHAQQQHEQTFSSIKDLKIELRRNRLELRTAEQKAEMFQERYYKLRQNTDQQLTRTLTQQELSRSKIPTDRSRPSHQKSTERQEQGKKQQALTSLKMMVRTHRLNIQSSLR